MKFKKTFILFIILIVLFITKPSEATFDKWLLKKYEYACTEDICVSQKSSKENIIITKEEKDYFFFNMRSIKLQEKDNHQTMLMFIKGTGILGWYIPFTVKPVVK